MKLALYVLLAQRAILLLVRACRERIGHGKVFRIRIPISRTFMGVQISASYSNGDREIHLLGFYVTSL